MNRNFIVYVKFLDLKKKCILLLRIWRLYSNSIFHLFGINSTRRYSFTELLTSHEP